MSAQVAIIYPQSLTAINALTGKSALTLDGSLPVPLMEWLSGFGYKVGSRVTRNSSIYRCIVAVVAATSTTAPESDASHWALDTTVKTFWPWSATADYAVNATVSYSNRIYQCIKAPTTHQSPTDKTYWTASDRDYPYWVAGTAYTANKDYPDLSDRVTYDNYIYVCVKSGTATTALPPTKTCNKTVPAISGYMWFREKVTNAMLMADGINYTATQSYSNSLAFTITPAKACGAICLLGVAATTLQINITGGAGFTAISKTVPLTGTTVDRIRDVDNQTVYYLEFPHTAGLTIIVNLSYPLATQRPSCGAIIVGAMQKIGTIDSGVQYGAQVSTTDYTTTTIDEFGTATVVKRAWAKDLTVTLPLPNDLVAGTQELIAFLRGTPCLYRVTASDDLASAFTAYGFAREFSATVKYATESLMSLTIKGTI